MPADPAEFTHSARTRLSLLFRLPNWQDAASWEEFYHLYHKLVFSLALRAGLSRPEAEEVTQDVFKRVAETIKDFESNPERGSFRGWLMNLTRWRISNKFRERRRAEQMRAPQRESPDVDATRTIERVPDESFDTHQEDEEWQRHVLEAALERLKQRVPATHFQAFDFYVRKGWSVMQVARTLEISAATVYVISHRLKKQLKAEVKRLQTQLG